MIEETGDSCKEVIFNYLGQFDQTFSELSLFGLAQESSGPTRSLQGKRCHLLEINGLVSGDSCDWTGRTARTFIEKPLESLAQSFVEALRSLIATVNLQQPVATLLRTSLMSISAKGNLKSSCRNRPCLREDSVSNKNVEAIYPLSPPQQGMLFETLAESGIHVEQFTCALHGNLNLSAFEQGWQRIVELNLKNRLRLEGSG